MPPAASSLPKNEIDVTINRTNVALARSQRLVASWLPSSPDERSEREEEKKEEEEEENKIFVPVPERYCCHFPSSFIYIYICVCVCSAS